MPINMTDYRMIINERVYNVLQIMIDFAGPLEEGKPPNQCANTKCAKHISKAYECGGSCSMRLLRGEPECAGYISRRKRK